MCCQNIITLQIKTVTAVLKVSTCITTSITCRANKLSVILATMSISIYKAAAILYIYICVMCNWCIVASPSTLKLLDYYLVFKQIVCILCCSLSSKCGYFLTTRYISIMLLINIEKDTLVN